MTHMAEHLEAILLKENLSTTDVVNLLAGNRVLTDKGYGDGSKAYSLITNVQIAKNKTRNIIEKRRLLEEIWKSSVHDKYKIELKGDFTFPRNYVIGWAKEKALISGSLFEEFSACIRYAIDQRLITPEDWEQAEEQASEYYDEDGAQKKESADTVKNRHRLIGLMAEMLQDGDLANHLPFKDQTAIGDYIENNYAEKYKGKGLKAESIKKILGKANRVLKSDEDI